MLIIVKIIVASLLPFLLAVGCAKKPEHTRINADVGFINVNSLPRGTGQISNIRLQALREGATTLGARGGLAWRSDHINAALEEEASYLDHIFDFNQLLLSQNILPPVLVTSQDSLTLNSNESLRTANQTYKIVSPARLVTAPPTWRTYLWMPYSRPDVPNKSLLPTTSDEAAVWDDFLRKGWQQGLKQANDIFSANLNRLKRDYIGMMLYRKLLSQGMISSPTSATANLGVTGDKNEIRINDAITRITSHSELELNPEKWKPVLVK